MYVDAFHDRKTDKILIAERINSQTVLREIPAPYVFYYEDANGTHRSIYGNPCKKVSANAGHKFHQALKEKRGLKRRIFESDISPVFRALADNYMGADAPTLNIGFFDIEADFHQERGYAPTNDPFNAITAITLYRSDDKKLLSFMLKPPTLTSEEGQAIAGQFADTLLFEDERELLTAFLDAIEDVNLLTGWNSSAYDIPYLVNRVACLLGKAATKRFCLWDQSPSKREYKNKFGRVVETFDFVGRVHLDYLELYTKHNTQQRHSYRLDFIGEIEVGENKTQYAGTLDQLYKNDFFKFIEYNRQDVMLMVKIDQKLKFIELANQIAHANCVLLKTTMGTVSLVEQAINNEMHAMGYVVPERRAREDGNEVPADYDAPEYEDDEEDYAAGEHDDGRAPVVGAYVAQPKKGLHDFVGGVDINSLYPSAIRALNMSPETLVGQVRSDETMELIKKRVAEGTPRAEAWEGLFATLEVSHMHAQDDTVLTVDFFDQMTGETSTQHWTAKQLHEFVFDDANHVCITANGTLFRTDQEGIIPALLTKWYADRKSYQKEQKKYQDLAKEANSEETKANYKAQELFWDQRQLAAKIRLNATYGALLNEHCLYFDERIGQSTTLSGRSIVRHMGAKINEIVTGAYDHTGDAVKYGDTDSNLPDTKHHTNFGTLTSEQLFELCSRKWSVGEKEYAADSRYEVLTYDPEIDKAIFKPFNYIYRHKVKKEKWRITDSLGNQITVTNDHSVMVERDGRLIEAKPRDITKDDVLISVIMPSSDTQMEGMKEIKLHRGKVATVEQLEDFDDDFVYDIGVDNDTPYYFGNDILVHNSVYFSVETMRSDPAYASFDWSIENVISLYDLIADETNATFAEFMARTFHTSLERGGFIKAGRELVASRGLFIKKKKYAVLMVDKEGKRLDVDGKPGKLKVMGLDLKRADTPKFMQVFLEEMLLNLLSGTSKEQIYGDIKQFRKLFKNRPGWEKGAPKKVSNLSGFAAKVDAANSKAVSAKIKLSEKNCKVNMPGHVRASLNWNFLCDLYSDRHAMRITDGMRIIVCKLSKNNLGMTSIAYPIDEPHLPQWFQELPFDHGAMEDAIVDSKILNVVGVLDWDLTDTKERLADDFFKF